MKTPDYRKTIYDERRLARAAREYARKGAKRAADYHRSQRNYHPRFYRVVL